MKNKDVKHAPVKLSDPKNLANKPYFQNRVLERMAITSPVIAFFTYVPLFALATAINYTQGYALGIWAILVGIAGYVFWSLAEYLVHRFLFHMEGNNWVARELHHLHDFHHHHPGDRKHLFMPFIGGWPIAFTFWLVFYLIIGNYSFIFFSGFVVGYHGLCLFALLQPCDAAATFPIPEQDLEAPLNASLQASG